MSTTRFTVQHRPAEKRYVLLDLGEEAADAPGDTEPAVIAGEESYTDYDGADSPQRIFTHTGVFEQYAGQGLASVIVQGAVDQAIADGFVIVAVCPYVAKWAAKHPEYAEQIVAPTAEHLRAAQRHV